MSAGSLIFIRHGARALILNLLPKLSLYFSRQPRRRCQFSARVCIYPVRVAQNLNMCCWVPAVAKALSLRCSLEPVQARGGNPGLLVGPDPSMGLERLLAQGRPACPWATFAVVALGPKQCLPLGSGPAVSFGQLGLASIPGTLLWVCRWQPPRIQKRGWELDA